MRKIFMQALVLPLIFFSAGCSKEYKSTQDMADAMALKADAEQETALQKNDDDKDKSKCRLVYLDWSQGGAGIWQYQYNNTGLADSWTIDYGGGVISEKIYYNKKDQIIKADEDYFGSKYMYRFFYAGKILTRITRSSLENPDQVADFRFTYNNKGQNTRQDDDINDEHVLMYYDALGNCTRTDIYLGTDLWYSDNYTFNTSVKNPWLNVPGIEIGFLAYGGTYATNKRFFTSNRTIIYDTDGTPFISNDYDPAKTVIQTTTSNLPASARYYDQVTQSWLTIILGYDNCGKRTGDGLQNNDGQHRKTVLSKSAILKNKIRDILHGQMKDKKARIAELRKQLRN